MLSTQRRSCWRPICDANSVMETRNIHLGRDIGDGGFARGTSGRQWRDIESDDAVFAFGGVDR